MKTHSSTKWLETSFLFWMFYLFFFFFVCNNNCKKMSHEILHFLDSVKGERGISSKAVSCYSFHACKLTDWQQKNENKEEEEEKVISLLFRWKKKGKTSHRRLYTTLRNDVHTHANTCWTAIGHRQLVTTATHPPTQAEIGTTLSLSLSLSIDWILIENIYRKRSRPADRGKAGKCHSCGWAAAAEEMKKKMATLVGGRRSSMSRQSFIPRAPC